MLFFKSRIRSRVVVYISNHSNLLCSSETFLPTCPNLALFHVIKSTLYLSNHLPSTQSEPDSSPSSHIALITSSHRLCLSHMVSNLKVFFFPFLLFYQCTNLKDKGEWSKDDDERSWSFSVGNNSIQSCVAKALSNLSQIFIPYALWYNQVNLGPKKLTSRKPQMIYSINKKLHLFPWSYASPFLFWKTSDFIEITDG